MREPEKEEREKLSSCWTPDERVGLRPGGKRRVSQSVFKNILLTHMIQVLLRQMLLGLSFHEYFLKFTKIIGQLTKKKKGII